jgi:hypothetical protein
MRLFSSGLPVSGPMPGLQEAARSDGAGTPGGQSRWPTMSWLVQPAS